ncbi:MAG: glycosyltransferase family 2 protein, partial [Deltaproteobacteria bacterium]|nr:glycosyltransferase family 2 protein [Deltaproteobacteria bacterium]
MKLSVLIPVYNEVNTLEEAIRRVRGVRLPKEIIVVEDGSTDGTRELLMRLAGEAKPAPDPLNDLKVLFQPKNQGKGAAVRSALSHVTGDVVVIQDADLEYDPRDYMRLLEPILSGQADVVYGTRFYGGGPHRVLLFWHYLGNQLLTLVSNVLTNLNLTDMEVGYKVFKSEVLKNI